MEENTVSFWSPVANHPIAAFVRESVWAYPILETVHMVGLGLLFGCIFVFDLRILGIGRNINVSHLAALLLPWVSIGFLINLTSGSLLFASNAVEFAANRAFQFKIAFLLLAGTNAIIYLTHWRAQGRNWDAPVMRAGFARILAALSIILWLLVIVAGRMIAYFE